MDRPEEEDYALDLRLVRSLEQDMKMIRTFVASAKMKNGDFGVTALRSTQAVIEKYQEQGQLLEPHLEGLLCPLMEALQSVIVEASTVADVKLNVVKKLCSSVHTFVTVCGYKTVVKFFPHQACNLEVTVDLLERCREEVTVSSILKEESTGDWETQCTLLLWLSILVLIPFDIASVDTSLTNCAAINNLEVIPPLVQRIIEMCKDYLSNPGPVREMASVLLSHLLCRPDMNTALMYFVNWTREVLCATNDDGANIFLVPGVVGVLAGIFKVGSRDTLLATTPGVWHLASQLVDSSSASRSPLLRKCLVKLIQRIGLVHLPPNPATWRYKQRSRSLAQNLGSPFVESCFQATDESCLKYEPNGHARSLIYQQPHKPLEDFEDAELSDNLSVPNFIEEVIEQLLNGLRDKVTVVRWSAAKGVGRVTGRLNLTLADEVVSSVLELFQATEGDGAWHGGCLALAELARRGLLLPERLRTIVPIVGKALHYDVRRGPHSVGSHVRDAAAYVTWAFARTYSSTILRDHLNQIAPALLTVACYDREVNCRRAAAAAFQEIVGRQGDFEHGIEVVNAADYFSLGTRSNAYLVVAVYVAQFEEYRLPLINEILTSKVSHWEKAVRELAAEALSLLAKYDVLHFEGPVLVTLLPWTLSQELCQRHGATLAIAAVITSLHDCGVQLTAEKVKSVAGIIPAIEKARLYRGKGGEIMRVAVSRLIECVATVRLALSTKLQKVFHDSIDENLRHPNAEIQGFAAAALRAFVHSYMLPVTASGVARTTSKYLATLSAYNPAAQRGAALALGALSFDLLASSWKEVIDALNSAISLKGKPAEEDAETRVNAVRGLACVTETIFSGSNSKLDSKILYTVVKTDVMSSFFRALDDYAIDNRGDVGSWIREAAIESIEKCTYILCETLDKNRGVTGEYPIHGAASASGANGHQTDNGEIPVSVVGLLAKQAVEKIDRIRDVAGRTLQRLLHHPRIRLFNIPHHEKLKTILGDEVFLNWGAPAESFPRLVRLLKFPEYRTFLLTGIVVSIGGLADSLAKISGAALVDYITCTHCSTEMREGNPCTDLTIENWLGEELAQILENFSGNDRVVIPTLKTLDVLFSRGVFLTSQPLRDEVVGRILSLTTRELEGCKDVVKLLAGVSVLSHLGTLQGPHRRRVVQQLLNLLFHRYPKVRKFAAEQIYLLLLQLGDDLVGGGLLEKATDMILETCWDEQLDYLVTKRNQIYELLQISSDTQPKISSVSKLGRTPLSSADENDNYAALVDAAGY